VDNELFVGCEACAHHRSRKRAIQRVAKACWVQPVGLKDLDGARNVHEQPC